MKQSKLLFEKFRIAKRTLDLKVFKLRNTSQHAKLKQNSPNRNFNTRFINLIMGVENRAETQNKIA